VFEAERLTSPDRGTCRYWRLKSSRACADRSALWRSRRSGSRLTAHGLAGYRRPAMLQRLRRLAARFPGPEIPFGEKYRTRHQAFVSAMLDDGAMIARFAAGELLPPEYGLGLDERCVEYPWLFAQRPAGELLDAGSTLNHSFVLDRLLPMVAGLHIVTLAYEGLAFPERGVSYVYGDLRRLPHRDGVFDTVASLSTLEHVGMDNSRYGGGGRDIDPAEERRRAVQELRRVTRPDGRLFVSVPYGRYEDHGWIEQFDAERVAELAAGLSDAVVAVYAYGPGGWQVSSLEEAATSRFSDHVPAAAAVACIAGSV
jgi:SAM-dependent methyltransferase